MENDSGRNKNPLSVTELTELIKSALEARFFNLRVQGEISNYRPASSGHVYFTLKDNDSILNAVMFRNRVSGLNFTPADGLLVVAGGSISVYGKRGSYQIVCETLQRAGEGDILALLEQRKQKLAREGLFDADRKRPLPVFPKRIAVITSPTGAAIRDIIHVLRRRNAGIEVVILPAIVQGEEAPGQIVRQIAVSDRYDLADVLIIARGGGSLEDLLPFSDEDVVRAVAASRLPVISAVGHEIDFTLCDLAADLRAPTPSAAAELVSGDQGLLLQRVRSYASDLVSGARNLTRTMAMRFQRNDPESFERLFRSMTQPLYVRLDDAKEDLITGMNSARELWRHRIELLGETIAAYSPMDVLKRGYAIVTKNGDVVSDAAKLAVGVSVSVRLHRGAFDAEIKELKTNENL